MKIKLYYTTNPKEKLIQLQRSAKGLGLKSNPKELASMVTNDHPIKH